MFEELKYVIIETKNKEKYIKEYKNKFHLFFIKIYCKIKKYKIKEVIR